MVPCYPAREGNFSGPTKGSGGLEETSCASKLFRMSLLRRDLANESGRFGLGRQNRFAIDF